MTARARRAVLLSLADRCEREEPGAELSEAIEFAILPKSVSSCPIAYTTSLDAAVTLVPDDRLWSVGQKLNRQGFVANLDQQKRSSVGATAALALCAAALRAIASEETTP